MKGLILPTQPILESNTAWPSDLDLAISDLSMRRYTNAVFTSQIAARTRTLGLDLEPMRVGHDISCIDYCCLAKNPPSIIGSPEPFTPDSFGDDPATQTLQKTRQDFFDDLPHAAGKARQDSIQGLSKPSELPKLRIDTTCGSSNSMTSPQASTQQSLQAITPSSFNPPKPRLLRSQSLHGRLEGNKIHALNLIIAPATLLECVFEERLTGGVEELTRKSTEYQTATAVATPSLVHSVGGSIQQDDRWMASSDAQFSTWTNPLLAMFARAYGV